MCVPDPVPINRVSTLVRWIEEAKETRELPFWFRGHTQHVPEIRPGILRSDFLEVAGKTRSWRQDMAGWTGPIIPAEIEFNSEFHRRAASLLPDQEDFVEVYFLAQHHGLPTRLLDWTTNPLAALFFAVSDEHDAAGEVILTIPRYEVVDGSPHDAACKRVIRDVAFQKRSPLVRQAIGSLFGEDECPKDPTWIPIIPDLHAPRMVQQSACFTLHMPGSDATPERAIIRFPIPPDCKLPLQKALREMGVSWATLFPDLDHVCCELVSSYGLDVSPKAT